MADIADTVLPNLTAAMSLLNERAPDEATNFLGTVLTAIEATTHLDSNQWNLGPDLHLLQ
ncbi:hypothetical protein [Longispora albida]|uniref:hypothetical protein n=1 Tax=Longispora albida TaxID=203523 RepID=UPI00036553BD|nr:hypothetical protein [Longispora albida]